MNESNAERARRGFASAARGDLGAIRDLLHPDVRWHGGDPSSPGACANRREVVEFIGRARAGRRFGELVDVIEAGDRVVVVMRAAGARAPTANLATFRDGLVVEMVHFPEPEQALRAAGVPPSR